MAKSKETTAWRYVKAAFAIKTKTPSQRLVLLELARYADNDTGITYPSYDTIMKNTSIGSRSTVSAAFEYLQEERIADCLKKGWGNQTDSKSSVYRLNYEQMVKSVSTLGGLSEPELVSPVGGSVSPVPPSVSPLCGRYLPSLETTQSGTTQSNHGDDLSHPILNQNRSRNGENPPRGVSPHTVLTDFGFPDPEALAPLLESHGQLVNEVITRARKNGWKLPRASTVVKNWDKLLYQYQNPEKPATKPSNLPPFRVASPNPVVLNPKIF